MAKAEHADKPKTVKVEALKYHTTAGTAYEVGDTYEVPEAGVDNLVNQGMAVRVDRAAVAKQQAADAKKTRKTAVEPMSTTSRSGRALAKPRKAKR